MCHHANTQMDQDGNKRADTLLLASTALKQIVIIIIIIIPFIGVIHA
jgi:hypothetical protein